MSATYARHSERGPAEIIPELRRRLPHNVQFILNCAEAIESTPSVDAFERTGATRARRFPGVEELIGRGGNICIFSLRRMQQGNQVFTCQHFQKVSGRTPQTRARSRPDESPLVVYRRERACTGWCTGLLGCTLNWKQVQRKDLITFAAHYPATVCTYLPLCVLINQAQTTLSAPLHFSTWLATSNSRARQPDETTCRCLLLQHLQRECS